MLAENFDALITFDRNLEHPQNFEKYPIVVFVLIAPNNTYQILRELPPGVKTKLNEPFLAGAVKITKL